MNITFPQGTGKAATNKKANIYIDPVYSQDNPDPATDVAIVKVVNTIVSDSSEFKKKI